MNLDALWTAFLDLVAQVVLPTWNNLIQYIPLLLVLLLIVTIAGLAWYWQRNSAANRPRVPKPLPAGRKPEDLHMPGPSLWPFVAPVGLMLVAFAVVFGVLGSLANLILLGLGVLIIVVGVLGWYLDANREYAHLGARVHGAAAPALGPGGASAPALGHGGPQPPAWSLSPPDGMHLPGPSAWPFLAPVGLLFVVAGLIFGPALIVGGLLMAAIASVGWLLDAWRELKDVEAHGHPTQADRDPERAWPRRLIPVYVLVGGLALLITLAPWLISLLPGSA